MDSEHAGKEQAVVLFGLRKRAFNGPFKPFLNLPFIGRFSKTGKGVLDAKGADAAYADAMNGRRTLAYHGIPVVDVRLGSYLGATSFRQSFVMLTDRRNLVLAVNTADMPGNEVRMWYNPDEMENRQRAVFMAGTQILDEALISFAYKQ